MSGTGMGSGGPRKPVSPHALGAVAVLVGLAWTFRSTLAGGAALHWLGAPFALFAAGTGVVAWSQLPLRLVLDGLVPLGIAWVWLRVVERRLPAHLFVYLFVAVFGGALFALLSAGALQRWMLAPAFASMRGSDAWIALLIMAEGEALATGLLVTGLALYRPDWLYTFDPDRYLRRPPPRG